MCAEEGPTTDDDTSQEYTLATGNSHDLEDPRASSDSSTEAGCCGRLRKNWSFDGNAEAKAWCFAAAVQGIVLISTALISIPLLKLAETAAGCYDLEPDEECVEKVYGFRPSSLLSLMQTATGIMIAVALPFVGALIDRTPYRRHVAIVTTMLMVVWNYAAIMLSIDTWFIVAIGLAIYAAIYFTHTMTVYAYIPELDSNNEKLTLYNSNFMIIRAGAMLPFFVVVGAVTIILFRHLDKKSLEFETGFARVLTGTTGTCTALLMFFAFRGLKNRPPKIKEDATVSAAVRQLRDTARVIFRDYRPLFWYMIAIVPYANFVVSAAVIGVTFLVSFLKATTPQLGIVQGILIIFSAIGSKVHYLVASRVNLLNDVRVNLLLWCALCLTIGFVVTGPDRIPVFYGCAAGFGTLAGWANPAQRMLYITLMPKGRETEFMGIFMFVTSGFVWVPPLSFTLLNELGIPMNTIILLGCVPFGLSLATTFMVGNYEEAIKKVEESRMTTTTTVATTTKKKNGERGYC